jgi:ABC-type nitrate/sulfonate/bicarbonate transport system ATPase subunit
MPEAKPEKGVLPVVLAARDCSISFGGGQQVRTILDKVTVEVAKEEIVCVIGPSGCGKTTLLRALAGLQKLTAGEVVFEGRLVDRPMRDLAVVFQDYGRALLPWRTVQQNVALALEARRVPASERANRIAPLLAQVGLQNYANHFPAQLSGGLQQRAQIARSLALQPKVLLMDEPFGALDAMTRQALQDELLRLASSNRMTVVFITHDLEEAIYLGDRVIALAAYPGRVAEVIDVDLPRPRDQLTTRELPRFLELRHHLYQLLQGLAS